MTDTTTTTTTTTFRTEPFTCPSCIATIESVLGRLDGVQSVSVRFASNRVIVAHAPDVVSADAIAERLTGLGYPVLSVRSA